MTEKKLSNDEIDALVRAKLAQPDVQQLLSSIAPKKCAIYLDRLTGMTFAALGERHQMSRSYAKQCVDKVRRQLRHPVRSRILLGTWMPGQFRILDES